MPIIVPAGTLAPLQTGLPVKAGMKGAHLAAKLFAAVQGERPANGFQFSIIAVIRAGASVMDWSTKSD